MPATSTRIALTLGMLAAVGPFAIDMYLPALPTIAEDLGTSVAATQTTLTFYFLAFGLAQLFYGPWSDQAGRRVPLYVGLTVFCAGSVGCVVAPTIWWLTAARMLQGLGAAVVMVVPRAVIRDLHTGPEATRLMATIMLVISVSPMLAPLAGSLVVLASGWRAIFAVLAAGALLSVALVRFVLPETRPPEARERVNLRSLLRGTRTLVTDRTFMGLTLVGGFGMASFFVFLASASFVYQESFGLGPMQFSLAFAVNAVGFFGASQLAAWFGMRFGMARTVVRACTGFSALTALLFLIALAGFATLPVTIGMLFLANACMGLVIPTVMVMALDPHGRIAGLASSLGGTIQMVTGGLMMTLAAPFFDATVVPMTGAIALCALLALVTARAVLAVREREALTPGADEAETRPHARAEPQPEAMPREARG